MTDRDPGVPPAPLPPARLDGGRPRYATEQLFGRSHEILIEHQGECYRLRITRQGKLILTK